MKPYGVFIATAVSSFCGSWMALVSSDVPITLRGVSAVLAGAVGGGIAAAWPAALRRMGR